MTAGERLRERVQVELESQGLELNGLEEEVLDRAVATADSIASLEAVVAEEGPTTKGHRGTITHPALTEIRHLSVLQHALLKTLLGAISAATSPADDKSRRGRAASNARWAGRAGNHSG